MNMRFIFQLITKNPLRFYSSYVQGQWYEKNIREYFYFIDHQGMLFLDDSKMKNFTSCFKEKKFLQFFFKNLQKNSTGRYMEEFPYLSLCGKEINYVRCDDFPIVYTNILRLDTDNKTEYLSYGHADNLLITKFIPSKLTMEINNGRVYYPAPDVAGSVGLVRSKLAIEFSKYFLFENGENNPPTHIQWKDKKYVLENKWYTILNKTKQ